jgi:glutathione S-transferase
MIKLFGSPVSTCTRKVLTTLAETNTPNEFNLVDLSKGEHKQEAHLARQPFGQIPALDDDGFWLYESRAIARYLVAKVNSPLVPSDIKQRALLDQWSSVEQSNFSPYAMKFIYHYVFKRPQEDAVLENANKALDTVYATISRPLARNQFLVGKEFTLADVGFMPYVEYMLGTPAKATMDKYPNVVAWWERVSTRPSWLKVTGKT